MNALRFLERTDLRWWGPFWLWRFPVLVPVCSRARNVFTLSLSMSLALPAAHAGVRYQRLKSFGFPDQTGIVPVAPVVEGNNAVLYGTTYVGGSNNAGTVFRLNR